MTVIQRNWRNQAVIAAAIFTATSIGTVAGVSANEDVNQTADSLELFSTDRSGEDLLPSFVDFSTDLDRSSARFIDESGGTAHWVVRNSENEICLVSLLAGTQKSSLTCADDEEFAEHGLSIRLAGSPSEPVSETHLVPDGLADEVAAVTGWNKVTDNLLSADPSAPALALKEAQLDGDFTPHDIPPTDRRTPSGQPSTGLISFESNAASFVRYAYRQEVDPGIRILSHDIRDGADMTGGYHNIYPDVVRATICGETTSSHPPNHLFHQACSRGDVEYDHGHYFGISRCFWAEDSAGDAPLTCRYAR